MCSRLDCGKKEHLFQTLNSYQSQKEHNIYNKSLIVIMNKISILLRV